MDEPRHPEADPSPYLKLPWPLVAGALAAVLLLALGAGLFANRYLRQPGVVVPTPGVSTAAGAATPATAAPTQPATATGLPVAGSTGTVAPNAAPATATPPPQPGTPTQVPPTVTPQPAVTASPSARPTVAPELASEIGEAYERYWQIRAEALFDLDTSRLHEVMAGEHLAAMQRLIVQLRAEGRAIEADVDHRYVVLQASNDRADVVDNYVDNSVYVDLESHAQLSEPTADKLSEVYGFSRLDSQWKVVSLARAQ